MVSIDPRTFRVSAFRSSVVRPFGRHVRRYDSACSRRGRISAQTMRRQTIPGGATYLDLDLLPGNRARWRRKGWIDLGGIAKGYAIDCGVAALRAHGVATGIVNAGGDLGVLVKRSRFTSATRTHRRC